MNPDKNYAERIAGEYAPKRASKVDALRKLDAHAKRPARIFAYTLGVISALILGVGMCLTMKVIGDGSNMLFVLGIIVGLIGIAGVSVNYLLYKKVLAASKQKYAFEIMQLAQEVSDEQGC